MSINRDRLLYLSSSDITAACAEVDLLKCVSDVLLDHATGAAKVGIEGVIRWSPGVGQAARTLNMPGLLENPAVVGTKIINANTGNPDRGLPRADGLTLLFDSQSARPEAILQAAGISALRTAAVSTIAARRLQRGAPVVLGVIGAGKIAEQHIRLMAKHLDVERVLVNDSVPERAHRLAEKLSALEDLIPHVAFAEAEDAVRDSDVIVTATTVTKPYIPDQWITPGSLVINVSLDDIGEETYLRADLLYVDDWELITADSQRLLGRMAREGEITGPGQPGPAQGRSVTGTLGQLLAGTCPSRDNEAQTALVNPFGMAIEDLAVAHAIYTVAASRGLGTPLER